ncbi:hypothetical protein J3F83DRAFT_394386 [Trichoderma novae-zelandiae]
MRHMPHPIAPPPPPCAISSFQDFSSGRFEIRWAEAANNLSSSLLLHSLGSGMLHAAREGKSLQSVCQSPPPPLLPSPDSTNNRKVTMHTSWPALVEKQDQPRSRRARTIEATCIERYPATVRHQMSVCPPCESNSPSVQHAECGSMQPPHRHGKHACSWYSVEVYPISIPISLYLRSTTSLEVLRGKKLTDIDTKSETPPVITANYAHVFRTEVRVIVSLPFLSSRARPHPSSIIHPRRIHDALASKHHQ